KTGSFSSTFDTKPASPLSSRLFSASTANRLFSIIF
ncbi:unnamed protein product, partial [Rotaria sordida]